MRLPICRLDQHCIGVAVSIPEPWANQLHTARASSNDPDAALVRPHITLVPPTCVPQVQTAALEELLTSASREVEPFAVHLRGTGSFRPLSPVVFVQVVEGISSCEKLHQGLLRSVLAQDLSFPYHPHVTVAQEVSQADLDAAFEGLSNFDASFWVDQIDLYQKAPDGIWKTERSFGLGRAGAPATVL